MKYYSFSKDMYAAHIWTIFNKNAHFCERSAVQKMKVKLQRNFIHMLLFFTRKNSQD